MDFTENFKSFFKEVNKLKQYKHVSSGVAFWGRIAVFPFIVASVFCSLAYVVGTFFFTAFSAGAEYLEDWVKQTKKGVSNPAEAAIYPHNHPVNFPDKICSFRLFIRLLRIVVCNAMRILYSNPRRHKMAPLHNQG